MKYFRNGPMLERATKTRQIPGVVMAGTFLLCYVVLNLILGWADAHLKAALMILAGALTIGAFIAIINALKYVDP